VLLHATLIIFRWLQALLLTQCYTRQGKHVQQRFHRHQTRYRRAMSALLALGARTGPWASRTRCRRSHGDILACLAKFNSANTRSKVQGAKRFVGVGRDRRHVDEHQCFGLVGCMGKTKKIGASHPTARSVPRPRTNAWKRQRRAQRTQRILQKVRQDRVTERNMFLSGSSGRNHVTKCRQRPVGASHGCSD